MAGRVRRVGGDGGGGESDGDLSSGLRGVVERESCPESTGLLRGRGDSRVCERFIERTKGEGDLVGDACGENTEGGTAAFRDGDDCCDWLRG